MQRRPDRSYGYLGAGARLFWELPAFYRNPVTCEEARATARRRLARRPESLLELVGRIMAPDSQSPYRTLLANAGLELGDVADLVGREGVEDALHVLFRNGVYLTVDELKGRRAVVRGSLTLSIDPAQLRNPGSVGFLVGHSSGSGGSRTIVPTDLRWIREKAIGRRLSMEARGSLGWVRAIWSVPGSTALTKVLQYAATGVDVDRWFCTVDPAGFGLSARYRWSERALRWASLALGVRLPAPEYTPLGHPEPILRWVQSMLASGRTPCLRTNPSTAVLLCRAALEAGIDVRGLRFEGGGEPFTEARLAAIRRAGADAAPNYAATETGNIARACLAPEEADEMHLCSDLQAVIQPGASFERDGLPARALLVTGLGSAAALRLINASVGDQAELIRRTCGCPMEKLGFTIHLHTVRSFEKLTIGGMTFLDSDVVRVLEEVLPTRFGGFPTDYQLVEDERPDGRSHLRLLAHPRLGPLDAVAVADTFLQAIGAGSGGEPLMALQWRQAGFPVVERRPPISTASGKILHLRSNRAAAPI